MQISLHLLYEYNNSLIQSWIGDNNVLEFFNYNMIERTKYLTVQTYKYKIRILWFIKANNQEFCDFLS